jgi:hypothetical protein
MMDAQAQYINASGRARTADFLVPSLASGLRRSATSGKGGFKQWTVPALLRTGLSLESSSFQQLSKEVDGAGRTQAGQARYVVAASIVQGQDWGMKNVEVEEGCTIWIRNLMFDESQFDLRIQARSALAPVSVFCSHGQWTYVLNGVVRDEHICRPPKMMSVMNSSTMWKALNSGSGGLQTPGPQATFTATLTSCDSHAANIKMLKFLEQSLPADTFLLCSLCSQHRTGNVVEQLTKQMGTLGGVFCVCKTLSRGHPLSLIRGHVAEQLKRSLVCDPAIPVACVEEWRGAKQHASRLIDLCCSFSEDESKDAAPGSRRLAFQKLLDFFDGPWTGLSGLQKHGCTY